MHQQEVGLLTVALGKYKATLMVPGKSVTLFQDALMFKGA